MPKHCPTCQQTYDNPALLFCGKDGTQLVEIEVPVQETNSSMPPDSLLMFFFANHFITQGTGFMSTPLTVPCQNAVVNLHALALSLLSIAFWSLREQGLIAMQTSAPKGLILSHTPVSVRLLRPAQLTGLENNLLQVMQWARTEIGVDDVVSHYLEKDSDSPDGGIIERMKEHAIHLNYGMRPASKETDTGKRRWIQFDFSSSREPNFLPDCQRILVLVSPAQNLQRRWQQFMTGEPALYNALINQSQRAISRRTTAPDRRDNFFDRSSPFD